MKGRFISDLALQNLKRNRRALLPFALSCIGTVMMFFIMHSLSTSPSLTGIYGSRSLRSTLQLGVYVMLIFSVIFLFYTTSFLTRQRKKEFGLFNLLGMEKRHIARVLLVETLVVGLLTTLVGLLLGALFSKLMYLLILSMLGGQSPGSFAIPRGSFLLTTACFLGVHALTLLNTVREVHIARPVELLRGGRTGEREPKGRLWLALLGLGLLSWGYWISFSVTNAIAAIPQFFQAVLLVILGTYLLFSAGTISLLNLLKRNKRFYYQARHFSVVAGLRHRMNRNAVGLATICILSTMVLVMASGTLSLFAGREDLLKASFPRDAMLAVSPILEEEKPQVEQIVQRAVEGAGLKAEGRSSWRTVNFPVLIKDGGRQMEEQRTIEWGRDTAVAGLALIPAQDYQAVSGEATGLMPGQALYYSRRGNSLPQDIQLGDRPLKLLKRLGEAGVLDTEAHMATVQYLIVLPEEDLRAVADSLKYSDKVSKDGKQWGYNLHFAFNTPAASAQEGALLVGLYQKGISEFLRSREYEGGYSFVSRHIASDRADFNALYGGLLFVAIFLGTVFIMAMVLIIYYKQISEGHEDKERYLIMQQVGMSQEEVRQSIRSQVLMVFFLPLLMAGLHLFAAFNIVWQVLRLLQLSGPRLFMLVCLGTYLLFALFYLLVYWKTARSYYRIVRA